MCSNNSNTLTTRHLQVHARAHVNWPGLVWTVTQFVAWSSGCIIMLTKLNWLCNIRRTPHKLVQQLQATWLPLINYIPNTPVFSCYTHWQRRRTACNCQWHATAVQCWLCSKQSISSLPARTHTHTHTRLTALCPGFVLQCFDAVGWAAGRASGL